MIGINSVQIFSWGKRWIWQQRNKVIFTSELLIMRIFINGVWCEGKKNWLCSTPLSFENEKWHGRTALSPKLVDLRQGPRVKEGCSVITMLLVFFPTFHFSSAVQLWCVILFCFWSCEIMWCWSSAFEKSSECIMNCSQAANGKCKKCLSFTNYQIRKQRELFVMPVLSL